MKLKFLISMTILTFYISLSQGTINRVINSPFPASQESDTLYVIHDNNFSESEVLIIQTLQGVLSKTKPLLYRDVGTGSSVWINDLVENKNIIADYSIGDNFNYLLSLFQSSIQGYILCDLHTHSSNIAISLCGLYNAIPVTEEHIELMELLNIPQIYDVRNKDYNWFLNNYSDSISNDIIIYQHTDKDLCLGDYSVFAKSLQFYDDDIHGELVEEVFSNMNTNSILLGWGSDEYQTVHKSSKNSIGVLPADYAYNLSVLTNFNQEIYQREHNSFINTVDSTHTVCFVMSDGDNIQWLLNWFFTDNRWFGSNKRGQVDIGWTISPALSELAPTVMNKIYKSAENNSSGKDYFIAGPSGLSYIYPEAYKDLEDYTDLLNKYMMKSDLNIVNIIGNSNNDFYLYSFVQQSAINAIFYYDFSNYSKLNGNIKFVNNKPIISARYNLWGGFENTTSLAYKLNNLPRDPYSSRGYSLIAVHNWSNSVDSILHCTTLLDNNIRVVSPDKFINLINQNISNKTNNNLIHTYYPNPTKTEITVDIRIGQDDIKQLKLLGENGKIHTFSNLNITTKEADLTSININIRQLNSGIYFLIIETLDNNEILKIIKI